MRLSIVTTLYNNGDKLVEFYDRIVQQLDQIKIKTYEIILVEDGSTDNSLEKAIELSKSNKKVTVIELSKNFGHHKAVMTGLDYAKGNLIFLIDSDLDEDPAWLGLFYERMQQSKADVVFGKQEKRNGSLSDRAFGHMFYIVFRYLTGIDQPNNILTVRLMTRDYVKALLLHRERISNLGGLWASTGYRQISINVKKYHKSKSAYNVGMKVNLFIDAITSFSKTPLKFMFYLGLSTAFIALIFVIWLLFLNFFGAEPPSGYLSIIVSLWLIAGILFTFLGIIGIYLANIFVEVKKRPITIVKALHRNTGK